MTKEKLIDTIFITIGASLINQGINNYFLAIGIGFLVMIIVFAIRESR